MILVWRRFGIMAFLIPVLCVGVVGAWHEIAHIEGSLWHYGVGVLLGGAAVLAMGWKLNVVEPRTRSAAAIESYREHLDMLIAQQLPLGQGIPMPSSVEEARAQADLLVAEYEAQAPKAFANRNTLFWVPMQWMGVLAMVVGLGLIVGGLASGR